ncbi:hypothetical protein Gohar_008659 [Gossypium harknessii]|uniref:DUF4283 domain-containing protein n=1 Tax=Gossypium harknessii TaxID=34285 RepID=A0A7J9GKD2_9ROSI|nr:hypothetical protein [Gossypium harknessii]
MEEDIVGLTLQDDEDEALILMASVVCFNAMRTIMANLWNLIWGICISDLGEKRFLFRFYIEMDIVLVIQGNLWTFINHLLVFHRLEKGEDPLQVSLHFVDFWVQVHDILVGFYNEQLARQFETFLGKFLDYDSKALAFGLKKILAMPHRILAQTNVWLRDVPTVGIPLSGGLLDSILYTTSSSSTSTFVQLVNINLGISLGGVGNSRALENKSNTDD